MKFQANRTLVRIIIFGLCILVSGARAENLASPVDGDDVVTGSIPIAHEQVPQFDAQKGKTPELGHCYHFKKMNFFAASWIEQDLQDAKWPNPVTLPETGEKVTRHEWIEIDTCARTMMAEIGGSKSACGPNKNYDVALARIMANRAKYKQRNANRTQDPIATILYPMKSAMEDKYQFSVWNAGAKVIDGAPCPHKTNSDAILWNQYVSLCKVSVLNDGHIIRMRTPKMTDDMLYYTSGCRMHYQRLCQGYTPIRVTVYPTVIDDYKCFEIWEDHHLPLTSQQQSDCSKQAKACCTSPKEGDHVIPEMKNSCDSKARSWSKNAHDKKKQI